VHTKVKMPRVGENVNSAFVVDIKVHPGQDIHIGETLISVETDKATVDIESPNFGEHTEEILREILNLTPEELNKLADEKIIKRNNRR